MLMHTNYTNRYEFVFISIIRMHSYIGITFYG